MFSGRTTSKPEVEETAKAIRLLGSSLPSQSRKITVHPEPEPTMPGTIQMEIRHEANLAVLCRPLCWLIRAVYRAGMTDLETPPNRSA